MKCIITGVYRFDALVAVHCVEVDADTNGNKKVAIVLLKPDCEKASKCVVNASCSVSAYKYNGKYYNYIKF